MAIAERASSAARPPGNVLVLPMASPPLLSTPPLVLAMPLCFLFSASVCELHFEPASSYYGVTDRGCAGGGTHTVACKASAQNDLQN